MIYVDSCIPMYLVGAGHPNKNRVLELVPTLLLAREKLITSAEAFQEIIHRYKAVKDLEYLKIAYDAMEDLVHAVESVKKEDVDAAVVFAIQFPRLSSRDCLHLASMKRLKCDRIWTFDTGFDQVPRITRIF